MRQFHHRFPPPIVKIGDGIAMPKGLVRLARGAHAARVASGALQNRYIQSARQRYIKLSRGRFCNGQHMPNSRNDTEKSKEDSNNSERTESQSQHQRQAAAKVKCWAQAPMARCGPPMRKSAGLFPTEFNHLEVTSRAGRNMHQVAPGACVEFRGLAQRGSRCM